jgi:hypothetical protein
VFPIIGGRKLEHLTSNINALNIHLSEAEMKEIEAATSFNLGYPYTALSGGINEHITTEKPGAAVESCCSFVGVSLPKAIGVVGDV